MDGQAYRFFLIDDVPWIPDPGAIDAMAAEIAAWVRAGKRAAVNCSAGLNRSGLLVGRTLIELGHTPAEAVELVRRVRGPHALSKWPSRSSCSSTARRGGLRPGDESSRGTHVLRHAGTAAACRACPSAPNLGPLVGCRLVLARRQQLSHHLGMRRFKDELAQLRDEEISERERRLLKYLGRAVAVAAVATLPITVVELNGPGALWVSAADWVIWLVFMTEWLLMMQFPPEAGGFTGSGTFDRGNWRDWRNWLSVFVLVISFPLLYPAFQLVRLVRVVRLARIGRATAVTTGALGKTLGRRGVIYVAALILSAIVVGGVLMASLEPETVGGSDIWNGMWWAATTTVGAGIGASSPSSVEGKVVTLILMLCGVAFISTLAGSIAAVFLGSEEDASRKVMRLQVAELHGQLVEAQRSSSGTDPAEGAQTPDQLERESSWRSSVLRPASDD
jgi:voltage-gated potassium channel